MFSDGTSASLSAESLETQLRAMKLDQSWNKPVETFLHTWSTRLHDLETIRDVTIPDNERRHWLLQSIKSHSQLYQGVTTANSVEQAMRNMHHSKPLTWTQFFGIILDQAMIIDSNQPVTKRKANMQHQQRNSTK